MTVTRANYEAQSFPAETMSGLYFLGMSFLIWSVMIADRSAQQPGRSVAGAPTTDMQARPVAPNRKLSKEVRPASLDAKFDGSPMPADRYQVRSLPPIDYNYRRVVAVK
jgi:hypothetical protein